MIAALLLIAAPAPPVRPPKPTPWPVGAWVASWRGAGGVMEFRPDGSYVHRLGSCSYEGGWERQGACLAVWEREKLNCGGYGRLKRWWYPWRAHSADATGTDYGTIPLSLEKKPEVARLKGVR